MSEKPKLSERIRTRSFEEYHGSISSRETADWAKQIEALETQLADAIRELDDARAELKTRTESLHTAVRLKLQTQSQRDALAKALRKIERAACGEDQIAEDDTDGLLWVWKHAREALAALDRTAPADGGK